MELRRVLVLGCSGSGKSTFALELARSTGLPLIHLDQAYWSPGWVERYSALDWPERVRELCAGERWVIDGNYSATLPVRLERATAIIWLDLPRAKCMWNITRRLVMNYGRVRPSSASGCTERLDWEFIKYVWNWHGNSRPRLLRYLALPHYAAIATRLSTHRQAARWLAALAAGNQSDCRPGLTFP